MEIRSADEAIARLTEGLDWLAENDPSLFCDGDSIKALECQGSRLECAKARAVCSFDQWGEWSADGALTATAWIDTTCHVPKKEARAQLRRGKALCALPLVAGAWKDGDIGAAHVDALIRVKRPVTEETLARDEGILVDAARTMKFAEFASVVDYWEQLADQDGSDEAAEAKKAQRDVYLYPSPNGYLGEMRFDPIDGAIVVKEHKRIEEELFEADWAEAKERLGHDPRLDELAGPRPSAGPTPWSRWPCARRRPTWSKDGAPSPSLRWWWTTQRSFGRISQLEQGPVVAPGVAVVLAGHRHLRAHRL